MSQNLKITPDDLIRMALSDKVSFEEIYKKYSINEKKLE